ncbi:MAG: hypothetical protein JWO57_981 [Pseudonocardiales bacterium]|nr:hypothetical protein [Pseudonocardiales bacterium]
MAAPVAVWAGTPGSDPSSGSWVGGKVVNPGAVPLVLWNLPGSGGTLGTCIDANQRGPLHGPYRLASTISDPVFGELNHLYAQRSTSDVRLAELSALNSRRYDTVDKAQQWSYVVNGAGGMSVADANAMLALASRLAGPYRVSISWPASGTRVDRPYLATVAVTSASGAPVPAEAVGVAATGASLAARTVTTNAAGRATVGFRIQPGTAPTFTISASVQSWTKVSTYTAPGEQRMLSTAPPTTQRGSRTGPVDRDRDVNLIKIRTGDRTQTPVPGYVYRIAEHTGRVVVDTITTASTAAAAHLGRLRVGETYTATEVGRPPGATLYIPAPASFTFTVPPGTSTWTLVAEDPEVPKPTVGTRVGVENAIVGQVLTDTVTVDGNDGEDATIRATLYGPITVPASGACTDLSLAQYTAGPSQTFTATVRGSDNRGNGDVVVTGPVVTKPGCYGWAETLTLTPSGATASSPPTAPHESVLVTAPAVTTTVSARIVVAGTSLTDAVVITGLNGQGATLIATLFGPLPGSPRHGCAENTDAIWRSAIARSGTGLVVGSQTMRVTGDGTYTTAALVVSRRGCYTYLERLTPDSTPGRSVTTSYGMPSESTLVLAPAVTTRASAAVVAAGGKITDAVIVSGTDGVPGTVTGQLLGPLAPHDGSCSGLNWSQARVAASLASLATTGDGTYVTAPVVVTAAGCYTFVERLTLVTGTTPVVTTPPGVPAETVLVQATHAVAGGAPTRLASAPPTRPASAPPAQLASTGPLRPIGRALLIGVGLVGVGTALASVARPRRGRG